MNTRTKSLLLASAIITISFIPVIAASQSFDQTVLRVIFHSPEFSIVDDLTTYDEDYRIHHMPSNYTIEQDLETKIQIPDAQEKMKALVTREFFQGPEFNVLDGLNTYNEDHRFGRDDEIANSGLVQR